MRDNVYTRAAFAAMTAACITAGGTAVTELSHGQMLKPVDMATNSAGAVAMAGLTTGSVRLGKRLFHTPSQIPDEVLLGQVRSKAASDEEITRLLRAPDPRDRDAVLTLARKLKIWAAEDPGFGAVLARWLHSHQEQIAMLLLRCIADQTAEATQRWLSTRFARSF